MELGLRRAGNVDKTEVSGELTPKGPVNSVDSLRAAYGASNERLD